MSRFNPFQELHSKIDAIGKSQAVVEFNLDGTIITANENFLGAMGYRLDEIQGKHHSMFVPAEQRDSAEYRGFWDELRRGEFQSREFKRLAKGGRVVWIQASYNPLLDRLGKPFKVVKFAFDITQQKMQSADFEGQIKAIHKSQAVIEFDLSGNVLTANENFLKTLGYRLRKFGGSIMACSSRRPIAIVPNIGISGRRCGAASIRPANSSALRRVAVRYGYRPPTTRFMALMANCSRL